MDSFVSINDNFDPEQQAASSARSVGLRKDKERPLGFIQGVDAKGHGDLFAVLAFQNRFETPRHIGGAQFALFGIGNDRLKRRAVKNVFDSQPDHFCLASSAKRGPMPVAAPEIQPSVNSRRQIDLLDELDSGHIGFLVVLALLAVTFRASESVTFSGRKALVDPVLVNDAVAALLTVFGAGMVLPAILKTPETRSCGTVRGKFGRNRRPVGFEEKHQFFHRDGIVAANPIGAQLSGSDPIPDSGPADPAKDCRLGNGNGFLRCFHDDSAPLQWVALGGFGHVRFCPTQKRRRKITSMPPTQR
jgi:hypothetical protein